MSPIKVKRAAVLPTALNTLVAPILPLPTFLRSIPFDFAIKTPKGMDPVRKERIAIIIISKYFSWTGITGGTGVIGTV